MFIESTPNERNDYANALRMALAAFKSDASKDHYVITPDDLQRTTPYNQGGAATGMSKLVAQSKLSDKYRVAKGVDNDTGAKVVAIVVK